MLKSVRFSEYLVEVRLLWEESDAGNRWKRDVDSGLPDHLSFAVPVQETDMKLRMRRSRLIPTMTSHSPLSTTYVENAAVYTDPDKRAALIVKRDSDQYSLEGSFIHAEKEWSIQPLKRSGRSHLISPISSVNADDGQAVSDEILINEPFVEILSLEDRNRYRLERLGLGQDGDGQQTSERQARDVEGYRRMKRSVTSHTIEIAFIVDYADYEKWVEYKGESNATTEMTLWYTYIAEGIKIRFETIDKSVLDITTVVNFLRILTNETDDDFIEVLTNSSGTFSGSTGLANFTTWYQDPANNISNADHYMYFTGFDINGGSGAAYLGTACTANSASLVENDFTAGTAVTASRELGHSLSAVLDDQTGGNCSDYTENIMSASLSLPVNDTIYAGNPWRFSNCSIQSFITYLATTSCTEPGNTGSTDVLPAPTGSALAGLVLSRDDQCKLSFRNDSSYYCESVQQSHGNESLCGGMYCALPDSSGSCVPILPLEYTTCGTDKWCELGFCVQANITSGNGSGSGSGSAPPTTTTTAPPTITTTAPPTTTTTAPPTTTTTAPPTTTTTASPTTTATAPPTTTTTTAPPTDTNTASTASESTAAPSTTNTASTASESTAAPSTTNTASTASESTAAPTTTNTASTASESTAAPTTTNTASTATSTASESTAASTSTNTASTASESTATNTASTARESTAAPTTTLQTTTELMTTTPPYTGPTSIFQCLRYLPRFQFFSFWRSPPTTTTTAPPTTTTTAPPTTTTTAPPTTTTTAPPTTTTTAPPTTTTTAPPTTTTTSPPTTTTTSPPTTTTSAPPTTTTTAPPTTTTTAPPTTTTTAPPTTTTTTAPPTDTNTASTASESTAVPSTTNTASTASESTAAPTTTNTASTASESTAAPTTTNTASTASESTAAPTTTNTASTASESTAVPTTTNTASTASESTAAPTTTNTASTASESTAAPTTTNTASTASESTAASTSTNTASTASESTATNTASTARESTAAPTTTLQTTTELMTTTPPYTGPTSIFQCLRYLPRFQFFSFWRCLCQVWAYRRQRIRTRLSFMDLLRLQRVSRKGNKAAYKYLNKLLAKH
ncbi:hypothetical protein PoB_002234800 [Plakobranchus ocellatus]|uniref:Peptidase M12B domain-containing protein n=1 Tax=Plakobranchus ocellatus TaxID=259542 RepID=A0AAV3ZMZ8_9GAST|nr:hypothetical protein PoB_002234800 [Plakobranchus ocellatus]